MRTRTVLVERMRLCERAKADERNYCNFELKVNSKRDPFVVIVCAAPCEMRILLNTGAWGRGSGWDLYNYPLVGLTLRP